jgi:hypothetical protein
MKLLKWMKNPKRRRFGCKIIKMPLLKLKIKKKIPPEWRRFAPQQNPSSFFPYPVFFPASSSPEMMPESKLNFTYR